MLLALFGAVALLVLGGIFWLNPPRSLQMRSAEGDFNSRIESGESKLVKNTVAMKKAALRKRLDQRDNNAALADWYGETNTAVKQPTGAKTDPVDESYLINDTRPFGAPELHVSTELAPEPVEPEAGAEAASF